MTRHTGPLIFALTFAALAMACGETSTTARPTTPPAAVASVAAVPASSPSQTPPAAPPSAETPAAESRATAEVTSTAAVAASTAVSSPATATPVTPRLVLPPPPPAPATPFSADARTVVIDAGHGGDEIGAANYGVVEKESNLDMAFRVERLLAERGLRVVMTRRADVRASTTGLGAAPTGFSAQRVDLQARIDLANRERAALFVSLHSNGSNSGAERGIEVYYDSQRPHSAENIRLATLLHDSLLNEVRAAGYSVLGRGAKDDACLRVFQGRCFALFLLGPERVTNRDEILRRGGNPDALLPPGQDEFRSRATQMPAALVELLFISNAEDAALLRTEAVRDAMARGVVRGITRYLGME